MYVQTREEKVDRMVKRKRYERKGEEEREIEKGE